MEESDLILLAMALSVLGYNIGILLMMLPLPFSGIKRWAPTLMKDSIFSLVMIVSVYTIVEVIGYFQELLGVSWSDFRNWLLLRTGSLLALKTALTGIILLSSKFLSGIVAAAIFEPIIKALNYSLTILYSIMGLGLLIKNYFIKILILGIVLFSVPFRFARGAGSYLIAFAIVFPVGLPLMPQFVDMFSQPLTIDIDARLYESGSIDYAVFQVFNAYGHPIYMPVLRAYDSNGELLFVYKGDTQGRVFASFPDKPIPGNSTFVLVLDYLDMYFFLKPYPFDPRKHLMVSEQFFPYAGKKAVLKAVHVIWNHPSSFAIVGVSNVSIITSVHYSENGTSIILDTSRLTGEEKVYASFLKECEKSVGISGNQIYVNTFDSEWYGLKVRTLTFNIAPSNGTARIDIYFYKCPLNTVFPDVEETPYLKDKGFSILNDLTQEASSIIISWLVLPSIYLFLLLSITVGVSYIIGGLRERIPIRII